jgi:hypothetical protein
VPLPSAVHTITEGRLPNPLSDYNDPRGHGLAVARGILAHQLGIPADRSRVTKGTGTRRPFLLLGRSTPSALPTAGSP